MEKLTPKISTPLSIRLYPHVESTPVSAETSIVETNLPIHKATDGDIMDTSEDMENLKRPVPKSTCPLLPLYTTFTPPLTELGEETSAPNIPNTINRTKKKPNIRSRSNCSSRSINKLEDQFEPAMDILKNNDSSFDIISFKYILEKFSNKSLNIHELCSSIGTNAPSVLKLT